ncbi:unnamed protein product [Paramecium sonneborni]|uniref:Protein translocase subunit SecA n=1 Tax=Paramecium sonneborni TaxID=65129 RepID=A0A8S1PPV9_9CILI|nr:unnamed protein product [Paramecium sonneborni]
MISQIANKNWSATDKETFKIILNTYNLKQDQLSILQKQIEDFQNPETIINCLLQSDQQWDNFQSKIKKEIPTQVKKKHKQQEIQSEDQLIKLKNELFKQIKSKKDVNYLIQYIYQENLNQYILDNVLMSEFGSIDEFKTLVEVFQQKSQIETRKQYQKEQKVQNDYDDDLNQRHQENQGYQQNQGYIQNQGFMYNQEYTQNQGNQQNKGYIQNQGNKKNQEDLSDQDYFWNQQYIINPASRRNINISSENQQIQDLFTEFQSLNNRGNQQVQNLLLKLYNSFKNQQKVPIVQDFKVSPQLEYEDLQYLCIKVKELYQYYPRPAQLLSVIELYNHDINKGRLAQIYTGEGKTVIIAMLAILLCRKRRRNVDIVTSSPVLAIRDAQDLDSFYKLFQVSVSHNINGSENQKEKMFPCYKCQVIYGEPHSFQADILRHEYQELGTMGDRQSGYIIVDEVDSMLIDGNSNKTLLSSSTPGMLDFKKVFQLIWDEICKQEQNLLTNLKILIPAQGSGLDKVVDLSEYVEKTLKIQQDQILKHILPQSNLNYISFMLKTWIESAILAKFKLQENKHYKIDNNAVRIIDFENTGVVHKDNTQWQKGLHQFIELKHNLTQTTLRICTNYISNITFFKRYKNQILGLTGTLGSQVTQNLLAKMYNVDFVLMPPYKKRLLKEEPGIATMNHQEWLKEILQTVQKQLNKKRAVLIINQTIKDVYEIEAYLKKSNIRSITYFDDSQYVNRDIGSNTVIIATNLAGRGTDLNTSEELERNGGLHVIMSFLPRNIRIQLQGFGRTARQGKQGTAQLIVNFEQNLQSGLLNGIHSIKDAINYYQQSTKKKQNFNNLDVLIYFRDSNEQQYSNEIENEMDRLLKEDICFQRFCQIAKSKINMKENRAAFKILEEKWGIYYEQHQQQGLNINDMEQWLNSDEGENHKHYIYQGLQQQDINLLQKAVQIQEQDPFGLYYHSMIKLQNMLNQDNQKQKEDWYAVIDQLSQSKIQLQKKIDNEKGLATAIQLNQMQIKQFEKLPYPVSQHSENQIIQQSTELPKQDYITKAQESEYKSMVNNNKNQKPKIDSVQIQIKVYEKVISSIDQIVSALSQSEKIQGLQVTWDSLIEKTDNNNTNENEYENEYENEDENEKIKKNEEKKIEKETNKIIEDIIQDGPLPVIARITKDQQKNKFQYVAMFAIGLGQFVVGCAICYFTCGFSTPIGINFISEGIKDMLYSFQAAWKQIDIDWGAWGQDKVISIATSLTLAGLVGIQEAFTLGKIAWKSLAEIGIKDYLQLIPPITAQNLLKIGFWLTDLERIAIQGKYDTLRDVSIAAKNAISNNNIYFMAQQIMEKQKKAGSISSETAQDLLGFVNLVLQSSEGNTEQFKKSFYQSALNYIRLQMAKGRLEQDQIQLKQDIVFSCSQEGQKKFNNVQTEIAQYDQYQKTLINELNYLSKIIIDFYSKDYEILKMQYFIDLCYENSTDKSKISKVITEDIVKDLISQGFSMKNKNIQKESLNLQINNPQNINKFYQKFIRPKIQKLCSQLYSKLKYIEPLEYLLQKEFKNLFDSKIQQLQQFQADVINQQEKIEQQEEFIKAKGQNATQAEINNLNQKIENFNLLAQRLKQQNNFLKDIQNLQIQQLLENIIRHMKNRKHINDDGITYSQSIFQEINLYLIKQNFSQELKLIIEEAMKESLQKLSQFISNQNKFLSSKIQKAIEIEIVEVVKFIFEKKMSQVDHNIMDKID